MLTLLRSPRFIGRSWNRPRSHSKRSHQARRRWLAESARRCGHIRGWSAPWRTASLVTRTRRDTECGVRTSGRWIPRSTSRRRTEGAGWDVGCTASLFAILAAQGYCNAYAGIALPNPASVALHESIGFEKIGVYRRVGYKFGQWRDVGWWQRILREHQQSPQEPHDLATVCTQPGWTALVTRGESMIR